MKMTDYEVIVGDTWDTINGNQHLNLEYNDTIIELKRQILELDKKLNRLYYPMRHEND